MIAKDHPAMEALSESIDHWRRNTNRASEGREIASGSRNCSCCLRQIEYGQNLDDEEWLALMGDTTDMFPCFGATRTIEDSCPIALYTGSDSCERTPYYEDGPISTRTYATLMHNWLVELYELYTNNDRNIGPKIYD